MNLFQYDRSIYPDRYTEDSGWVKVLPIPGRALQTAEVIEMQSILQSNQARALDSLFKPGAPLSGLVISRVSNSVDNSNYSVSAGSIYIEGMVVSVPSASLSIPNLGTHTIGVSILEKVITEKEDASLRDPLRGGALYGTEGSARLVWKASITVNDQSSFPIGIVSNAQISQPSSTTLSLLTEEMALHTYERMGNFISKGLGVVYSRSIKDSGINTSLNNYLIQREEILAKVVDIEIEIDKNLTLLSNLEEDLIEGDSYTPLFVEDLRRRIEQLKILISSKERDLLEEQVSLSNVVKAISTTEARYPSSEVLTISPGVAYVEGYRVVKDQPISINIPKSLGLQKVIGASYTYTDLNNSTHRQILLEGAANFDQVKRASTILTLAIDKIPFGNQLIPIRLSLRIDNALTSSSIAELIDLIVEIISNRALTLPQLSLSSRSGLEVSTPELRQLLSSSIRVHKNSNSSLLISSNLEGIEVSTYFSNSLLKFDIRDSLLASSANSSYQLGFTSVHSIDRLLAHLNTTGKVLNRGPVIGGVDELGDDTVTRITKVYQGDVTYKEGRDYQLLEGHYIDWSIAKEDSKEPSIGSSYLVDYIYTQELDKDKDYRLISKSNSVEFIGKRPAYGYTFLVDYSYYLSQAGIVLLDKKGLISYILGVDSYSPQYPVAPNQLLPLAKFILKQDSIELSPVMSKAWSLREMNQLVNDVRSNSISNSLLRHQLEAQSLAPSDNLGIFNDPLINLESINLEDSSISLLPTLIGITVPTKHKDVELKWEAGGVLYKRLDKSSIVSLPSSSEIYIEQDRKTSAVLIERSTILTTSPMEVYPSASFLNTEIKNVCPIDPLHKNLPLPSSSLVRDAIKQVTTLLFSPSYRLVTEALQTGLPISALSSVDRNGYIDLLTSQTRVGKGEIVIRCYSLPPRKDGYKLYFSGTLIDNFITLNQTSATSLGIRSDSQGYIDLMFTLPPSTQSGVHAVELISPGSQAKGRLSIYNNALDQVVLTNNSLWIGQEETLLNEPIPIHFPDLSNGDDPDSLSPLEPLMQTFSSEKDVYLSSIDIYIEQVSISEDMYLTIRSVSLGLPQREILAIARSKRLRYSLDGSVYSRFHLERPLLLSAGTDYCIGVNAPKNYSIFLAQVGKKDILTGYQVGLQPIQKGNLWVSPNGIDLVPKQRMDLTYRLNVSSFSTSSTTVALGEYGNKDSFPDIYAFSLNTRDVMPAYTFIQYEYKAGPSWKSFSPNIAIAIEPTNSLSIRALIRTSKKELTPLISLEGSSVSLYSYKDRGSLLSNRKDFTTSYHNAYLRMELYKDINSNVEVLISSNSTDWVVMSPKPNSQKVIDPTLNLVEQTYQIEGLPPSSNRRQFYYRINMYKSGNNNPPIIRNITTYAT